MVYLINRKMFEFPSATFNQTQFWGTSGNAYGISGDAIERNQGVVTWKIWKGHWVGNTLRLEGKAVQWIAKMRRKKHISGNLQGFGFEAVEADSLKKKWERGWRLAWIDKKERCKKQGQYTSGGIANNPFVTLCKHLQPLSDTKMNAFCRSRLPRFSPRREVLRQGLSTPVKTWQLGWCIDKGIRYGEYNQTYEWWLGRTEL